MAIPLSLNSPRAAVVAVFAGFGAAVGGIAGSIPVLLRQAGLGTYDYGVAATLSMLATVVVMAAGGQIARLASNRAVMLVLLPAIALTSFALLIAASPAHYFTAAVAFGAVLGGTDLAMNAEGSAIEHDLGRPVFTAFHGALSAVVPVFALLGSALSNRAGPWSVGAVIALSLAGAWIMVWRNLPARAAHHDVVSGRVAGPKGALVLIGLIAGLTNAAEITVMAWSAKLLDTLAPQLAVIAGLGTALYGVCTAAMRFSGDALRARFKDMPVLIASICVAVAGFAALSLATGFAVAVAAFAIVGLGAALFIPCAFSLAAALTPDNRAGGLSFVSAIAGPARVAAPWAFGWLASETSVSQAFGAMALVLAVALALAVALRGLLARA